VQQNGVLKLLLLENTGEDARITKSSADRVAFILHVESQLSFTPKQAGSQGNVIHYLPSAF
jgi:hypothetical protein